jgi:ATP-dependent Clp protease ATP-binding subunit ClpA
VMPKINVYLPDDLATAVRDAQVPVSAICQAALERAVSDVLSLRGTEVDAADVPGRGPFMRFTPRARQSIANAQTQAQAFGHAYVGTEHVLLGILDEGANLALKVIAALEVEPDDLRVELEASMEAGTSAKSKRHPFTPLAKQVLVATSNEAHALGHNYIGCEHLLLGLITVEEGLASQVLRRMGIDLRTTRRAVVGALSGFMHARSAPPTPPAAAPAATLDDIVHRLEALEQRSHD